MYHSHMTCDLCTTPSSQPLRTKSGDVNPPLSTDPGAAPLCTTRIGKEAVGSHVLAGKEKEENLFDPRQTILSLDLRLWLGLGLGPQAGFPLGWSIVTKRLCHDGLDRHGHQSLVLQVAHINHGEAR